jgi:hypothetical protein
MESKLYAVYNTFGIEQIISIHRTEKGAEKNKKAQTEYSQEWYRVDYVVVHD